MKTWQKYIETQQTSFSAYTFVQGTSGRVRGVTKPIPKTPKDYTARTFRGDVKRILDTLWIMLLVYVMAVTATLAHILRSIIGFKWIGSVRKGLTGLYWRVTSMLKKTAPYKLSTGSKNSKKISMWDRLFAYVSLIIFAGLAIRPLVVPDVGARLVIVVLATHSIIRRFR